MIERTLVKSQAVSSWERIEYVPDEELNAINSRLERAKLLNARLFMHEAIDAYSRAIAIEPFNADIYCMRGHRYMSVLAFAEAVADFIIASRIKPES